MRKPDLIIGPPDNPQTHRWHLWTPKRFFRAGWRVNLHRWFRSDDDRALHDHRSDSWSIVLRGGYWEVTSHAWEPLQRRWCGVGSIVHRKAATPHRVELEPGHGPVWSLWIRGPYAREWGFYCPKGWRSWKDYVDGDYRHANATSIIGKGCND